MKKSIIIIYLMLFLVFVSCTDKDIVLEQNDKDVNELALLKSSGSGYNAVTSTCTQPSEKEIFYGVTNTTVKPTVLSSNGMSGWKLVAALSDEFNYDSGTSTPEFLQKWNLGYINSYTRPAPTKWTGSQVSFTSLGTGNKALVLKAQKSGSDLLCGIITSKKASAYPLYQEARVKASKSQLANAVWMISNDVSQLEEIDNLETYGPLLRSNGTQCNKPWYAQKLHLSHHTFKKTSTTRLDYQPETATWMMRKTGDCGSGFVDWSSGYHIFGVKWESAHKLIYFVDGKKVKTVTDGVQGIDPKGYTEFGGLKKEMYMIISQAAQAWRYGGATQFWNSGDDISGDRTKFFIDWIRVYTPSGNINTSPENYKRDK